MENIFAPEPQFRQGQYHKLSDNVNEWEQQIYSNITGLLPQDLGLQIAIQWSKVDDSQGYAVGSAILTQQTGLSVGIPLIIKQWHLAPLDTMMMGDKAYPFNESTIQEVFMGTSIADGTVNRQYRSPLSSMSLQESTMPPAGGKYAYSSDKSSLLDEALKDALTEDVEDMTKSSSMTPEVLTAAHKNGTIGLFNKVAKTTGKKEKKKNRKRTLFQVAKKGVNEYSILGNPEGVFDPLMQTVNRPLLQRFVENTVGFGEAQQEIISRVDRNQEAQISVGKEQTGKPIKDSVKSKLGEHGEVLLYDHDGPMDPSKDVTKFGIYAMKDPAGVTSHGFVFTDVIDFNGKKVGLKIFAGKNASSVQSSFAGVHCPDHKVTVPKTEMDVGKFGTLIYTEGDKALATVPFKIQSQEGGAWRVVDFYGRPLTLRKSYSCKGIAGLGKSKEYDKGTYLFPSEMHFFELNSLKKMAENKEDFGKTAALNTSSSPVEILYQNNKFIMKGAGLNKYANVNGVSFDMNSLHNYEMKFLLGSFGCSMEKQAWVQHHAMTRPFGVKIYGLSMPKLASEVPANDKLEKAIKSLRVNLVKEASMIKMDKVASVMDEGEVVDVALSLGFINPDNVEKFIVAIPKLKETLSILSKLLIASRLGMSDIPESATSSAVRNLLHVVEGLKKLGLLMKHREAA